MPDGIAVQVNILEAKNRLSQLVKAAQSGQEIVIANRGQPVARLVGSAKGAAPAAAEAVADAGGIVAWLENHPLPAYARRSAQEIEAALAEERHAWE